MGVGAGMWGVGHRKLDQYFGIHFQREVKGRLVFQEVQWKTERRFD